MVTATTAAAADNGDGDGRGQGSRAALGGERAARLLAAALDYAAQGLSVGPLWPLSARGECTCQRGAGCASPGKHPWTPHGLHDFTTEPAQIHAWWARRPFSGIGFATGARSGRLVLDIDPRHGGDEALHDLERRLGPLPQTPLVLTGGGGAHYHFALAPGGAGVRSRVLAPGVELKGDGTLCVLPPSRHASGRDYLWDAGHDPAETPLGRVPGWVMGEGDHLTPNPSPGGRGADGSVHGSSSAKSRLPSPSGRGVGGEVAPVLPAGSRNTGLTRLVGALRRQGLSEAALLGAALALNAERCVPPLEEEEVRAICHSLARYEPGAPLLIDPVAALAVAGVATEPAVGDGGGPGLANPKIGTLLALLGCPFPPVVTVVERVVYEGVTLLGGRPKLGKSWLTLGCALSVALDTPALGGQAVTPGDVLYLALEDGPRRLQRRLTQLLGDQPPPANFVYATRWCRLDQGGLGEIIAWAEAAARPRLIVIDTLKRVRPPAGKQGRAYDEDYDALAPLTDLVTACPGLAILVVHHTRKASAEDVLDEISGSTGLTGSVDGVMVLRGRRGASEAELHVTHRDAEGDAVFTLKRQPGDPAWRLTGELDPDQAGPRLTPERQAILAVLKAAAPQPLSPKEVAAKTWAGAGAVPERHVNVVTQLLRRMLDQGQVICPQYGRYTAPTTA